MPKLPAYVFRRANGSYRYKRNVPKKLVGLIGKATLYRQLGESYAEAMRNLPKVHSEIEKLEPPHLNWSSAMFRKRRTDNDEQTTEAGRNYHEVEAS